MNATDELAALLAAVVAEPECDTVRLVVADWFQSNGEEGRAEFIRLQCELENVRNNPCATCSQIGEGSRPCAHCRWGVVDRQVQRLLAAHRTEWLPKCPACKGAIRMGLGNCTVCRNGEHGLATGHIGTMRRGFAYSLAVRFADVFATISAQGVGEPDKHVPTRWVCDTLAALPTIERVFLTDAKPWVFIYDGEARSYQWWDRPDTAPDGTAINDGSVLTPCLMARMKLDWKPQYRRDEDGVQSVTFKTEDDANDALAECVVNVVRDWK